MPWIWTCLKVPKLLGDTLDEERHLAYLLLYLVDYLDREENAGSQIVL